MGLNQRKKVKKMILTGLMLLFTFSIILAVPPKITTKTTPTKTQLTLPTQTTTTTTTKASSDVGEIEWDQIYGGGSDDWGYCVEQTTDGGYIIVGRTESYGGGDVDIWLIKTDANGNIFWDRIYGGGSNDWGLCVEQTVDGGYIITGVTQSYGGSDMDIWLIKTDENGNHLWNQTYGGTLEDRGLCVEQTVDGGYIITGNTLSFGPADTDVWLIKTNSTGGHEWNQTYGRIGWDYGECVEQASDGGYIIVGRTDSYGPMIEVWLIKTDPNGDEVWNKTYGGADNDWGLCVEQTVDGGYIITGWTYSFGAGYRDVWLIKTDSWGVYLWNQTYGGGTGDDVGLCVEQTVDGGYIITGYTYSFGAGGADFWLIKTDASGIEMWNQTYGGTADDASFCVEQAADGGYIIVGYTRSYGGADQDIWLVKVSPGLPVIDHPPDVLYEEGSTGHNITWHPRDPFNPHMFNVMRNDTLVNSSSWDGGDIMVNVDGLSVGTYIFTCSVNDTEGFGAIDSVTVAVVDTTSPTFIDSPADISYVEGTTGHNITWSPSDVNPDYCIITRDEAVLFSSSWDGSPITVNVDLLPPDTYTYICTVFDEAGNSASDTVTVTVTEEEGFPWLWVGISVIVVVALIGSAVIYFKKR